MLNSIRNISKICVNQLNINKSSLPVFAVMNRTYADHSKASHLYTTFMNSGPDLRTKHDDDRKSHWLEYNDKVFSPQDPSEERRPAVSISPSIPHPIEINLLSIFVFFSTFVTS